MKTTPTAYEIYADQFGTTAANRNPRRIEILESLMNSYGTDVSLREIKYSYRGESRNLRHRYEEFILGYTNTGSRGAGVMVIAEFANEDVD